MLLTFHLETIQSISKYLNLDIIDRLRECLSNLLLHRVAIEIVFAARPAVAKIFVAIGLIPEAALTKKEALLKETSTFSFEAELGRRIRAGESISDSEFDQLLSGRLRLLSNVHWTPVNVAIRAAAFATSEGQTRVLDIGSGVGKFCTIGALTSEATFVGIEQRKYLIDAANEIAGRLNIENVRYVHANATDVDWSEFQSIYLFNPFSENLDRSIYIDELCELSVDLYVKYVRHAQWQLSKTRSGTTVVIYNRFGGDLPPSFECVLKEEIDFLSLEVWRKR